MPSQRSSTRLYIRSQRSASGSGTSSVKTWWSCPSISSTRRTARSTAGEEPAGRGPPSGGASCRRSRDTPGGPAPGSPGVQALVELIDGLRQLLASGAGASPRGSGPGPTRCPRTGAGPAPTSDARGRSGPPRPPAPAGRSPGPRPRGGAQDQQDEPDQPSPRIARHTKSASSLPPHEMRFRAIARAIVISWFYRLVQSQCRSSRAVARNQRAGHPRGPGPPPARPIARPSRADSRRRRHAKLKF